LFGGVPTDWRDYNQEWANVFQKYDIISPWTVGRYHNGMTSSILIFEKKIGFRPKFDLKNFFF